jgi:hypothetical protein
MGGVPSKQEKVQPTLESTPPEKDQHAEITVSEKAGVDTTATSERAQSLDSEDVVSVNTNFPPENHGILHKNVFITSLFNNVPSIPSPGILPWLVEGTKPP